MTLEEGLQQVLQALTWVKVVRCRLLAGVGQLEEGAWCTDIPPPDSPSVFSFLKAPSETTMLLKSLVDLKFY